MSNEKLVPVQGDGPWWLHTGHPAKRNTAPPGMIAWAEHLEAYEAYADRYGRAQSAERLVERGGFGYHELVELLGHKPTTWVKR